MKWRRKWRKKIRKSWGEGKRMAAGGPASLLLAGGREWKLGAQACPGTLTFIPAKSAHAHSLPPKRLSSARRWAGAGAAPCWELLKWLSNPPKQGPGELGDLTLLSWQRSGASDLSVNKLQVNPPTTTTRFMLLLPKDRVMSNSKVPSSLEPCLTPDSPFPGPSAVLLLLGDGLMPPAFPHRT